MLRKERGVGERRRDPIGSQVCSLVELALAGPGAGWRRYDIRETSADEHTARLAPAHTVMYSQHRCCRVQNGHVQGHVHVQVCTCTPCLPHLSHGLNAWAAGQGAQVRALSWFSVAARGERDSAPNITVAGGAPPSLTVWLLRVQGHHHRAYETRHARRLPRR